MMILMTLLMGCWPNDADRADLDFSALPFNNGYLQTEATITFFDTTLPCPGGEGTRFAAVYPDALEGPAPVAIVLHSGAFDYLLENDLDGAHYFTPGRLDRGWAVSKIWETLGLSVRVVDAAEQNLGTLPAALTNAGVVQLFPANCWGDLWHNEQGAQDNDYAQESFARNGRTVANWMTEVVTDVNIASSRNFSIPVELNPTQVYLIGLGEGGRGVVELLQREGTPPIAGVLLDSFPDDLTPYIEPLTTYQDVELGISRIFGEENLTRLHDWSLHAVLERGTPLPPRMGLVWSDGDPRLPLASIQPTAEALSRVDGAWVSNRRTLQHTFLNSDMELAEAAVNYLLDGTIPSGDVGGSSDPNDTGDTGDTEDTGKSGDTGGTEDTGT